MNIQKKNMFPPSFIKNNLTKPYLVIFIVMLSVFTFLTFLITNAGLDDGPKHYLFVFLTSLFSITGPLTGAISRGAVFTGSQNCCLKNSLMLMMYCAPFLFAGIVVQFFRIPQKINLNNLHYHFSELLQQHLKLGWKQYF